jgi:glucuronate isomerase
MNTPLGFLPLNSGSMRALVDKINEQSEKITMMSAQLLIRRDRIESLKSGPGGIMAMKQTIADKEKQIAERDMFIEIIGMNDDFEEFLSK